MTATPFHRTPREGLEARWQPAWDALHGLTGGATFVEVFAQAPEMLDFVMNRFYGPVFFGGKVEQRYKQLARLRLSFLDGCRTCNKQNVPGALGAGFSQRHIDALAADDLAPFDRAERAVIGYADQIALTNMDGEVSAGLYDELRASFTEEQILELGTAMAVISGLAKLSFVLKLVEKEPYCPFAREAAA